MREESNQTPNPSPLSRGKRQSRCAGCFAADGGPLLHLDNISVHFPLIEGLLLPRVRGALAAVEGVTLSVGHGEVVGLVGESGCGKSTLARAVMRLLPLTSGAITIEGRDITKLTGKELRASRSTAQMVFQDPYASLNPRMTVFDALAEPLRLHRAMRGAALSEAVASLMESVGLAARFVRKYPHEFSGGQRQRIALARALAVDPKLIIADEPVSSLDVSIQAQILNLLADLTAQKGLAMLFISHDLSVVRYLCSRIAVMYKGEIVEEGKSEDVFGNPRHEYTKALLKAVPPGP